MTISTRGFKLRISDHKLNIKQKIDNVPYKDLWAREVVFNMFQALLGYLRSVCKTKIDRPVEMVAKGIILKDFFENVKKTAPKLCFYNLGGMSGEQLEESCHFNSNVQDNGKHHGENGCFGQGEKMTLLNFTDILKISYKNGIGHYYILTNSDGEPEAPWGIQPLDKEWLEKNKEELEVDLNHDWTITILLGKPGEENLKHHNTVTHPHSPTGDKEVGHLVQSLFRRLYDFPSNDINLVFLTDKDKDRTPHSAGRNPGERMPFKTTSQVWNKVIKAHPQSFVETVEDDIGFKYHFYYDAPDKNENPSSKSRSSDMGNLNFMSLIHGPIGERERYDVQFVSGKWKGLSSRFGIYQDEKYFRVDIELPFEKYKPYGNREGVKLKNEYGGDGRIVTFESFVNQAVLVKEKAVKWSQKVAEHKSKIKDLDLKKAIEDKLKDFFNDIEHVGKPRVRPGPGPVVPNPNPNPKPPKPGPTPPNPNPRPKIKGSSMPAIPDVIVNPGKTGDNHFAVFEELGEKGNPILFVNPTHKVVNSKLQKINHPNELESRFRKEIVDRLGINLAVKILIAKAFRDNNVNGMDHEKFKSNTDPANLTLQTYWDEDVIKELRSDDVMKSMKQEAENNKTLLNENTVLDPKQKAKWKSNNVKFPIHEGA